MLKVTCCRKLYLLLVLPFLHIINFDTRITYFMNKKSDLVILPYLAISKKVLYAKTVWLVSGCHTKLKDIHKFMSYSTKYFRNKLAWIWVCHSVLFLFWRYWDCLSMYKYLKKKFEFDRNYAELQMSKQV